MIFVELFNYVVGFINTYSNLIMSIVNVIFCHTDLSSN